MSVPARHPILGRLVVLLGGLGVLVGLVATVSVWRIGGHIHRTTGDVVEQLNDHLTVWVSAATDTQAGIKRTRGIVRNLETMVKNQVKESVTLSPETRSHLEDLESQLQSGIGQLRTWLYQVDAVMAIVEQGLQTLEASGRFFQRRPEGYQQLMALLAAGQEEIRQLGEWEHGLRDQLAALRNGSFSSERLPRFTRLSDQIDSSLLNLDQHAETFQGAVGRVVETLDQLRAKLRIRVLLVQLALTALLAWQTAAQASLVILGRRWYAPPPRPDPLLSGSDGKT